MGILQIKRGETKPALQPGEPFLNTKKHTLNIGEDLILSDPALAAAGFGESVNGRILIIHIEAGTKKASYYYAEPNANADIEIKDINDKIFVIIGSGVTLDGDTIVNLSSTIRRAQVMFMPLVDFSENSYSVQIVNANQVSYVGGPQFKLGTNNQKIYGGKIEIKGVIYFTEGGDFDGGSFAARLNGMSLDTDYSPIFNIANGQAGEVFIKLYKDQNSFLKAMPDANIYVNARPIFTPDYPHASQIVGVDIQTTTTPENENNNTAVTLKPYGIDADGNKKYYPEISDPCAVQFSIEIISIEEWADSYFDI